MTVVQRADQLERLADEQFDVAIVGGGITGAGIALDAATRGLRVALVERRDFAAGTSSRTTKLIHGGLRYLAQGHVGVTRVGSVERSRLLRLAPHLVRPLPFVVPVTGIADRLVMSAGLTAYDLVAGFHNVRNHYRLSRGELAQWFPVLQGGKYAGGLVYYDGQTDDVRLTVTVIKEALRYDAAIANRCQAIGFGGSARVNRLLCRDVLSGAELTVRAHRVVLACGVWVDEVLASRPDAQGMLVKPAKGVHLILPREPFGDRGALLLRHPDDRRYIFVIPWKDRTLVGTTDTAYSGNLAEPPVTGDDVRYLLRAVRTRLPGAQMTERDVIGVQAGLRPLVNTEKPSTDEVSREDRVSVSPDGIVTIAGGKLTVYRHMAEKVVDQVVTLLQGDGVRKDRPRCRTTELALGGFPLGDAGQIARQELLRSLGERLPADIAAHLLASYGAAALRIGELAGSVQELAERLVEDLPIIMAEARYAVESELAVSLSDVLTRRLGLTLLDPKGAVRRAADVARQIGSLLGWDQPECERQVSAYRYEAALHTWG